MDNKSYQISGTKGINQSLEGNISFGHYHRNKTEQTITGRAAYNSPIDTASTSETVVCQPATKKLADELFTKWNTALQSGDAKKVADLYAEDAVLLPTVSNLPRTTPAEIEDYFKHFLQKKPFGIIKQRNIKQGCNKLTDAGVYDFEVTTNGKKEIVPARYTFVYEYRNNTWKIIHHHSSMMPEAK
ncbi:MAG: SgcJ/EcaC family oxidoreductase [Thiomicrorhabdus chilensis]|uniref:SgcJ/EcaC family oxidoreductase n=1 Tax=Thiomicrorhabdus chilensis TaxID=63656 RepID=UPI00040AB583|nr:SgcJ/EcaC family oxidoreductase [Thiomicrorhabdus chilensis]MDX1348109.1 SgcJ/EcaC family oxidoreductase [Thiomicrorhabdus chilensis]